MDDKSTSQQHTLRRRVGVRNIHRLQRRHDLLPIHLSVWLHNRKSQRCRPHHRCHLLLLQPVGRKQGGAHPFLALPFRETRSAVLCHGFRKTLLRDGLGDDAGAEVEPVLDAGGAAEEITDAGNDL